MEFGGYSNTVTMTANHVLGRVWGALCALANDMFIITL